MSINRRAFALSLAFALGCGGGSAQPSAATCEAISTDYATALAKAEECTLGTANTCTTSVIASFWCRCHTFVSGPTTDLSAISARFDAAGCVSVCNGLCAMAKAATCQADTTSATGGRCVATF